MDSLPGTVLSTASVAQVNPFAVQCFMLASFVLQVYEWLVTVDDEIQRIWLKPWTLFTAYWVLVRYLPLTGRALGVIGLFKLSWSTKACDRFAPAVPIVQGLAVIIGHVALLMRVYVLWDRRWAVSLPPSLLWLLDSAANVYSVVLPSTVGKVTSGAPGCTAFTIPSVERARLTLALSLSVAFDVVVTALVVVRCVSFRRLHAGAHPLVEMLLLHGIGYFGVVLVLNILNLVFLRSHADPTAGVFMLTLVSALPNIIINRMILSLRAYDSSTGIPPAATHGSLPSGQRSIQLTSPFGLNTMLESFEQPRHAVVVPADAGYRLSDMRVNGTPPGHV